MTFNEICKKAVAKWGVEAQLDQAVEEAAELIQAINKFKRYNSPWPLMEEMVDVEIMVGQLKAIVREATGGSNNRMYNRIREEKLKKVERKLDNSTSSGVNTEVSDEE